MIDFLKMLFSEIGDLLSFFVTVALIQNIVLTTGFGASLMLHIVRKPKNIWLFTAIMAGFAVLTVIAGYPLDLHFGTGVDHLWRPLMMVGITAVLYILATLFLKWLAPAFYSRVEKMLPLAAFNNLVTGVALVSNAHFGYGLGGNIGLAIGASLSFGLLTWLVAEGIERMDNPDMPEAFRGMPSILLYVGILALALMGFASSFSFI